MRAVAFGLLLVLLASGCVGKEGPVDPASTVAPPPDVPPSDPRIIEGGAPPNETVPKETGLAGDPHPHDGWGSASRMTVFTGEVAGYRDPREDMGHATFQVDQGFVLEGTSQVEVTLQSPRRAACSPLSLNGIRPCAPPVPTPAPPEGMHLFFRHASTTEWLDAGEIMWTGPIVIPIEDVTWTDMPHSGRSLWDFDARSADNLDRTLVFDASVDIVRGEAPIPMWPGHPRFYGDDMHLREVLAGKGHTKDDGIAAMAGVEGSAVSAERLISFGTRSLVVSVNVTGVSAPPGVVPSAWELAFANATGLWNQTLDAAVADESGTARFILPVDDAGMDSPYAPSSRWKFILLGDFETRAPVVGSIILSGFTPYEVDYDIRVVASDLPVESFRP